MSEEDLIAEAQFMSRWQQHKFMLLVGATIALALALVALSLWLYTSSGAMQLDLSRPGYQSVRDQVEYDKSFTGFSSSGSIDKKSLDEFRQIYSTQLEKTTSAGRFGGDVLSDESLSIGVPTP